MANTPSEVVVYRVVGERREDPGRLLLASPDGRWYDYDIARGTVVPAEPADGWTMDAAVGEEVRIWTPASRVV
jgi:hypothetical protein